MTFQEQYDHDKAATASAIAAGIPAVIRPRPLSPDRIGSYNVGPCVELRSARLARGLHPLAGGGLPTASLALERVGRESVPASLVLAVGGQS